METEEVFKLRDCITRVSVQTVVAALVGNKPPENERVHLMLRVALSRPGMQAMSPFLPLRCFRLPATLQCLFLPARQLMSTPPCCPASWRLRER